MGSFHRVFDLSSRERLCTFDALSHATIILIRSHCPFKSTPLLKSLMVALDLEFLLGLGDHARILFFSLSSYTSLETLLQRPFQTLIFYAFRLEKRDSPREE